MAILGRFINRLLYFRANATRSGNVGLKVMIRSAFRNRVLILNVRRMVGIIRHLHALITQARRGFLNVTRMLLNCTFGLPTRNYKRRRHVIILKCANRCHISAFKRSRKGRLVDLVRRRILRLYR